MSNLMSNPPLFVAAVLVFVTIVVALTEALKKEYQDRVATALATAILDRRRPKKRMIVAGVINDGAPPKRKRKSYDRNRARLCIQSDYIGPNSTSCDDFLPHLPYHSFDLQSYQESLHERRPIFP
jgi:hypothetical protein